MGDGDGLLFYLTSGHGDRSHAFVAKSIAAGPATARTDGKRVRVGGLEIRAQPLSIPLRETVVWEEGLPIRPLIPSLQFIKRKKAWGTSLQGGLRLIPTKDFDFLKRKSAGLLEMSSASISRALSDFEGLVRSRRAALDQEKEAISRAIDRKNRLALYDNAYTFELNLRKKIRLTLGKSVEKRIRSDLPAELEKVKSLQSRDGSLGWDPDPDFLTYASYELYRAIIQKYHNQFKLVEPHLSSLLTSLDEWYRFGRNPLMHFRPLEDDTSTLASASLIKLNRWLSTLQPAPIEDGKPSDIEATITPAVVQPGVIQSRAGTSSLPPLIQAILARVASETNFKTEQTADAILVGKAHPVVKLTEKNGQIVAQLRAASVPLGGYLRWQARDTGASDGFRVVTTASSKDELKELEAFLTRLLKGKT